MKTAERTSHASLPLSVGGSVQCRLSVFPRFGVLEVGFCLVASYGLAMFEEMDVRGM